MDEAQEFSIEFAKKFLSNLQETRVERIGPLDIAMIFSIGFEAGKNWGKKRDEDTSLAEQSG